MGNGKIIRSSFSSIEQLIGKIFAPVIIDSILCHFHQLSLLRFPNFLITSTYFMRAIFSGTFPLSVLSSGKRHLNENINLVLKLLMLLLRSFYFHVNGGATRRKKKYEENRLLFMDPSKRRGRRLLAKAWEFVHLCPSI